MTTETQLLDMKCPNCDGAVQIKQSAFLTCEYCGHHLRNLHFDKNRGLGLEDGNQRAQHSPVRVVAELISFLILVGIGLSVYFAYRPSIDSQPNTPLKQQSESRHRQLALEAAHRAIEMQQMEAKRQELEADLYAAKAAAEAVNVRNQTHIEIDNTFTKSAQQKLRIPLDGPSSQALLKEFASQSPAKKMDTQTGYLSINSIPSSLVLVDGKSVGSTPVVRIQVSASVHDVVLMHPTLGRKVKTVHVESGKTTIITVRL